MLPLVLFMVRLLDIGLRLKTQEAIGGTGTRAESSAVREQPPCDRGISGGEAANDADNYRGDLD